MTENELATANIGLLHGAVNSYRSLWPGGDRDEAVGVAQAAYLRALRDYNPTRGRLSTLVYWYIKTDLLRQLEWHRRECRWPAYAPTVEVVPNLSVASESPLREPGTWWTRLLLEEDLRIITLRARGLTCDQIAVTEGCSIATIKTRFSEIREALALAGVSPDRLSEEPRRHCLPRRRA